MLQTFRLWVLRDDAQMSRLLSMFVVFKPTVSQRILLSLCENDL